MAEHAINRLSTESEDKPVILIVDDSRVVRVSLKNILKNDCHLVEAEDGQQAWELLLEHPHIRLIFSDLSMPRLDGRGLLKKIRQSEITRIKNLPFIIVTGNEEDSGTRQSLLENGATEIVTKPFDPANIVNFANTLITQQENESYLILPDESHETELLPGIASQSQFTETASKELSFAIRNKNELAVALLKIDQFDSISNHYSGHAVEHILMATTEIIRQHIHPDDTMGYFGNGLFAILRPASNAIGTRYIGRRILEDLTAKQFYLGESDDAVSASIGISAPEIKHGTRLRELLLLAEGRLKAAMDLGGNRVIDKGNDTLTPVDSLPDSSQDHSAQNSSLFSHTVASGAATSRGSDNALSASPSTQLSSQSQGNNGDTAIHQITDLQKQLSLVVDENKDLQTQVDRWYKQSAESEQLRQRVFELESEQQQIHLKLSELQTANHHLQKRVEETEHEKRQLIENEEERTTTLKQANQFYEEENLRLQGQLDALSNRAQKAETAYRDADQLNTSLKDNISLLREQLEQVQQQLIETQQQALISQAQAAESVKKIEETLPETTNSDSSILDQPTESEQLFNGFPTTEDAPKTRAPVVKIFPDTEPVPPQQTKPEQAAVDPVPLSIPVYRREPEKLPREPRSLSSFTIASLILIILIGLGGGYLYNYLQNEPETVVPDVANASDANKSDEQESNSQPQTTEQVTPENDEVIGQEQTPANSSPLPYTPENLKTYESDITFTHTTISDEAKLQAELIIRQMAEEEFNQQLRQIDTADTPVTIDTTSILPEPMNEPHSETASTQQEATE
ncbi:MAG: response regulator [Candidatus Thiodiazotropha sp. (ex Monitilora ramsayi)]|nr:response regulator [Candidatus Thiodiazotropha sp. (ex Monitilora ramsayi)]